MGVSHVTMSLIGALDCYQKTNRNYSFLKVSSARSTYLSRAESSMQRVYAARGSRKAPSVCIGEEPPFKVLTAIRRKVFQAACKWGRVHVLLYPDGSVVLTKQHGTVARYLVGTYPRSFHSSDLRDDIMESMRLILAGHTAEKTSTMPATITGETVEGIEHDA